MLDDCHLVLKALGLDAYSQLFEKESKKQGKKFLYYYNGVGGHYLSVEQLDRFVLNMLKMADFDEIEPLANMSAITDAQLSAWITKATCQTVGKKHYLTVFLDEKQIKTDLGNCPKMSGQVDSKPLKIEHIEDTIYLRDSFMVDNISSVRLRKMVSKPFWQGECLVSAIL